MRKPGPRQYMGRLNLDERELQSRLRFFELKDEDFQRLFALKGFAESFTGEITQALYELILGHPETRAFFPDEATVQYVKKKQNEYFQQLFSGKYDLEYVENRLAVGAAHERIGMPPKWYLGAYRRYLQLIHEKLAQQYSDPSELWAHFSSIQKIIFFDMALALDTYIAAHMETMSRQKAAIRELSTPVIEVHPGILLLPLVGTIDTQRAQQVMETSLAKIVDVNAKVIILDIAGVPVVDTRVADHLIRTTGAIRLLGAQVILTGISAQIAQTVVQLGIEISGTMHTRTRLSAGIDLALDIIGRKVTEKAA